MSRLTMRRVLLLLLLVAVPSSSSAKPPKPKAKTEAAMRYDRGVSLYKEGNYPAALAEFRAAQKAQPGFEVLFNIGLCERRLFKYGDAVRTFNAYLEQGGDKVPKERRDAVAQELEQISSLTAEVTITVEGAPARLFVDGEPQGSTPLSAPLLVGPGKHTFKAERDGGETDEVTLELVSATKKTVKLEPKKASAKPGTLVVDSSPSGAIFSIDGQLGGAGPLTVPLEAGGHQVVAELDGYQLARTEVVIVGGEERKLTVALEKIVVVQQQRPFPVAGVVTSAGGLVLLAGGLALNFVAQGAARQTTALFMNGGTWDAAAQAVQANGQRAQAFSGVLTAAAVATLTIGVVLIAVKLFGGPPSGDEEVSVEEGAVSWRF